MYQTIYSKYFKVWLMYIKWMLTACKCEKVLLQQVPWIFCHFICKQFVERALAKINIGYEDFKTKCMRIFCSFKRLSFIFPRGNAWYCMFMKSWPILYCKMGQYLVDRQYASMSVMLHYMPLTIKGYIIRRTYFFI